MQELHTWTPFLTTKMAISLDSSATTVFSTCELVYVHIWIFFWRWFWTRYGRITSYRFPTWFIYQIILYRISVLQATSLQGYSTTVQSFLQDFPTVIGYLPVYAYFSTKNSKLFKNRPNWHSNCLPKYQKRLWRQDWIDFYILYMTIASIYRSRLSNRVILTVRRFRKIRSA